MPTLCGIVCGWNQAETLQGALDSLRECDHVVYLDGGSTDDSIGMVEAMGEKYRIVRGDYHDGGGPCRNRAAAEIDADWYVWLSSDDVLEPQGIAKIRAVLEACPDLDVLNVQVREKRSTHVGISHRVFRKGVVWHGRAHEYPTPLNSQRNSDIVVTHMRGSWHDKPTTEPAFLLKLLWADMQDEPLNPRPVFYFAREFAYAQDWPAAAYWFEKRAAMPGGFLPESAESHFWLGHCYKNLGDAGRAKLHCLMAIELNTEFGECLALLATLCEPGSINRRFWAKASAEALNRNVLFQRGKFVEKPEAVEKPEGRMS